MSIEKLTLRENIEQNKPLEKAYQKLQELIEALNKKEIPEKPAVLINQDIDSINTFSGADADLIKALRSTNTKIRKLVAKELKLVPKGHHRNMWMVLGMSVFGLPMGVVFSTLLGNFGFIGLGLPIGMGIGVAVGAGMDKKAADNGNQLDIE